ncbi:hypothetical protein M0638_24275 [Roseomonas sp. NAR14]|uniref:Uncharacterized protein n=1 Tax=Roseomonas acroporae TaxID=2937791 RepID=A0A9X1YCY4_9PROT|nr:hypothetical protein [Roseomonas acroporae]MCK8787492.1 hypothetical protein [Roseomonas acroporae]
MRIRPVQLFLDLDGVLADFDRGVRTVTGRPPEELPLPAMWRALARHPDFFDTLEFMADAEALWRFCAPHHPTVLTGLPLGSWARRRSGAGWRACSAPASPSSPA